MGLDMYLYKKDESVRRLMDDGTPYADDKLVEVAYWRKANAIRGWFVNSGIIQEDDDCVHRPVSREQIGQLIDDCKVVLDKFVETYQKVEKDGEATVENTKDFYTVVESTMPRTSGFFFGDNEIDSWYLEELKDTVDQLTTVLETSTDDDEFVYSDLW